MKASFKAHSGEKHLLRVVPACQSTQPGPTRTPRQPSYGEIRLRLRHGADALCTSNLWHSKCALGAALCPLETEHGSGTAAR